MPLYMYQAAYTSESWATQLKNPQNRIETVGRQACEAVGGKLVGGWYCFGEYDVVSSAMCPQRKYVGDRVGCRCARCPQGRQDDCTDDGDGRRGAMKKGAILVSKLPGIWRIVD